MCVGQGSVRDSGDFLMIQLAMCVGQGSVRDSVRQMLAIMDMSASIESSVKTVASTLSKSIETKGLVVLMRTRSIG